MLLVLSACVHNFDDTVLLNKVLGTASIRYCLDLADQLKNAILK